MMQLVLELVQNGVVPEVVQVMEKIPRELFVPQPFQDRAFENAALPIGHHQTISQPLVVAQMTQALDLNDRCKVLEIGTGSGYQAAVLAPLCRRLYTIERHKPLSVRAEQRFQQLRIHNIVTRVGDGSKGWPEQAPFDRIIVTAAAIDIPPVLVDQLAVGGVMVVPIGDDQHDQRLVKLVKDEDGPHITDLGWVRFVPFVEGEAP
ncbi:MAG: protein-L-isoaspartate(D-aspartate) O-methyltransferase [Alphaproteobacteria bacterium]|nr:protein-L-isoaspartate(D-aspartate) O-methyltransferase [Alphaproteobacteria bacterium]MBF0251473.1 protein-L-isoaspartate(D-aspartate) O-methyltransferase [Alphaproteobacteria bacterium]